MTEVKATIEKKKKKEKESKQNEKKKILAIEEWALFLCGGVCVGYIPSEVADKMESVIKLFVSIVWTNRTSCDCFDGNAGEMFSS